MIVGACGRTIARCAGLAALLFAMGAVGAADMRAGQEAEKEAEAWALFESTAQVSRDGGWLEFVRQREAIARRVIHDFPGTLAAEWARILLADDKLSVYLVEVVKLPRSAPEARPLVQEALDLYRRVAERSGLSQTEKGREVRAMAAAKAAHVTETLGQQDEALALYELALEEAPGTLVDVSEAAVGSIARLHRERGDTAAWRLWTERYLREYPEGPSWEGLVRALEISYLRGAPWEAALCAALIERVLSKADVAFQYEETKPMLQEHLATARSRAIPASPEVRVRAYLGLWEKGYYEALHQYLTPEARTRMSKEKLAARMKSLSEAGVRPKEVGEPEAEYLDDHLVTVRVHVQYEKDQAPDFVSGPQTFRLVEIDREYEVPPAPYWVMEAGPLPE